MKIPSLTIAIVALNEQANISRIISALLSQKITSAKLNEILIISDGSTDSTVKIAKSFRHPKIKVHDHSVRLGQTCRLANLYQSLSSDILVKFDADIAIKSVNTVEQLIIPFRADPQVGMVCGKGIPLTPITFTEKAVHLTRNTYLPLKHATRAPNRFSVNGRIFAVSRSLAKQIHMPSDVVGNDVFVYLSCIKFGFSYIRSEKATIYYRHPQTLSDHIRQNSRFLSVQYKMRQHFSTQIIEQEFQTPEHLLLRHMFINFIKHPWLAIYIFSVNRYCAFLAQKHHHKQTGIWSVSTSTKKI